MPLNPPEGHVEEINDDDADFIINNSGNKGDNDPLRPNVIVQQTPQQGGWQQGYVQP